MTQTSEADIIGVDVSKDTLDIYLSATDQSCSIANDTASTERWLARQAGPIRLAIEPTNTYHLGIATAAHVRGHQVDLIDPYRLVHYREGVGQRVKANDQDARLLARYLQSEIGELRVWTPPKQGPQRFWHLLKRRASLVQTVARMKQSLTNLGALGPVIGQKTRTPRLNAQGTNNSSHPNSGTNSSSASRLPAWTSSYTNDGPGVSTMSGPAPPASAVRMASQASG